jgi:transposase
MFRRQRSQISELKSSSMLCRILARASDRFGASGEALDGHSEVPVDCLAEPTLRDWVHRYNAEGIAGLWDRPRPGRTPKLSEGQMASLKAIVLAGPDPATEQIGRWRVVDLCRYVEARWAVSYSETGMLRLLWSLDLSHRKTRPRHPQSDEKAQQAFKTGASLLA